jgi:ABC-type multidrug transport system fused ATPase/permease subunit
VRQLGSTLELEDFSAGAALHLGPGSLSFAHVSACYRPGLPKVLDDVSFAVSPGEKVKQQTKMQN